MSALIIGKFYPPHLGHHYLISEAERLAGEVTVLVMASSRESIPMEERTRWLQESHPTARVISVRCDVHVDLDSSVVWDAQVAIMQAALRHHGLTPTSLFSSEGYGEELARRLGLTHHLVDLQRAHIPISATQVRTDPLSSWGYLAPATRAGLTLRVPLIGSESTGTTTLSQMLAQHFQEKGGIWQKTNWVPEYGRTYTEHLLTSLGPNASMEDLSWKSEDFALIAKEQLALEEDLARTSSPLLICDTDSLATLIWEKRYTRAISLPTKDVASLLPFRPVYFITDHEGVPFHQDGFRDGEHVRAEMTQWFIDELTARDISWVLLTGSLQERFTTLLSVTERLLEDRFSFAPSLG